MNPDHATLDHLRVLTPGQAADRMGVPTGVLADMIRRHRYPFTALRANGQPGDRGCGRWGLTEAQLATIVAGQSRMLPARPEPAPEPARRNAPFVPPGGVSRLRLRRPIHPGAEGDRTVAPIPAAPVSRLKIRRRKA